MLHGRRPQLGHGGQTPILFGVLLVLAFTLVPATAATAAPTKVKKWTPGGVLTLTVTSDSALPHDISVGWNVAETEYTVTDSVAMDADTGCHLDSTYQVTCSAPTDALDVIRVTTGDQNDTVDVGVGGTSSASTSISLGGGDDSFEGGDETDSVDAGAGNDFISGAGQADALKGEAGDDTIEGGAGIDVLDGGVGDDTLDGGSGRDYMFGQEGTDVVSYVERLNPVEVTIDGLENDGEAGEGDNVLMDVENVRGGSSDDTLVGDDDVNSLRGGYGNDLINSRDSVGDDVQCSRDQDVALVDVHDSVSSDCETIDLLTVEPPTVGLPPASAFKLSLSGCTGRLKNPSTACVQIRCEGAQGGCDGELALEAAVAKAGKVKSKRKRRRAKTVRTKIGSESFSAAEGGTALVRVRLSKQGAKLLRKKGSLTVRAAAEAYDAAGELRTASGNVKLRAKTKKSRKRR